LLGSAAVSVLLASQTAIGRSIWGFLANTRTEVRKVVWPTRAETTQTVLAVLFVVVLMGVLLWLLDMFLLWAVRLLTGQGG
jgi:preprotein translocase subunit SecE